MIKYDIVIITVPFVQASAQTGPAILKAVLQKEGFKCKVIDWNFDILQRCQEKTNLRIYGEADSAMKKFYEKNFDNILLDWINELKLLNPKWIGLSIFSHRTSKPIIKRICQQIRLHLPNSKIVAGGHGVSAKGYPLGDILLNKNLIDYYISGDGENAIISLLKNKKNIEGVNDVKNPTQILDLDIFPFPDYSDTPPNIYLDVTFIISSRGCIYNCQFCTGYYKKFVIRNPKNVVNEIVELYQKYQRTNFNFADSLSNGNKKHILNIANLIIDYNNKNILPKISWSCEWVCRPKKIINEEVYQKISLSGCNFLLIGIESGSEKVRKEMNKPIKDEDVIFLLEQSNKNDIMLDLLFIIGYYTETEEDYQQTLELMKKANSINKSIKVNIGIPYSLPFSMVDLGVKFDNHNNWYYKSNTFPVRCRRWIEAVRYCKTLNIPILYFYKDKLLNDLSVYEKTPDILKIIKMFKSIDICKK